MKQQSILFFCGDGNSLVNFRGNLIKQFIKKDFKVYAIDLLGFGYSDKPNISYTVEVQSTLVNNFLNK